MKREAPRRSWPLGAFDGRLGTSRQVVLGLVGEYTVAGWSKVE